MRLVYKDKTSRVLNSPEEIKFSTRSSFHLVVVKARVKGEKQISKNATDDEDLIVKIDKKTFPKLESASDLKDSPAAFSGGKTHGFLKTIYYLTFLKGKNHSIIFTPDDVPGTATFEGLEIYMLDFGQSLNLTIENKAEDGDRRNWITVVLDDLPLSSFTPSITYKRRKRDSDDVKVIVDSQVQKNVLRTIKHFLWRLAGILLHKMFPAKKEAETIYTNLGKGLHYIEFVADRMPTMHNLVLNFGEKPETSTRVPSVDDPRWTDNFYDDSEEIILARMIFGEAENQSREAKTGVGFTAINRVNRRGLSLHEVILEEGQYDAFWNSKRWAKVRDPIGSSDRITKESWRESYAVAMGILDGSLTDPSRGATNFHSFREGERFPNWAAKKNYKVKIDDIYFYEVEN